MSGKHGAGDEFDPVAELRAAGCPVDLLSEGQCEALAALSAQETAVLITVHQRFQASADEVLAHDLKLL
jgi:hypothetical protein